MDWEKNGCKTKEEFSLKELIDPMEDVLILPPANYSGRSHPIHQQPVNQEVQILEPIPYEDCLDGFDQVELSFQEISHFKSQGFIIKRGLIDNREEFDRLVDYYWDHVPAYFMDRDDSTTWFMNPNKKLTVEDSQTLGRTSSTGLKFQSPFQFGTEPAILALSASHPNVQRVLEQFIGNPVRPTKRVRGLYGVSPTYDTTSTRLSPHVDVIPADISAMVIVTETPPRCGGFCVWPGSHINLYPFWDTRNSTRISTQKRLEAFFCERDRTVRILAPVECVGSPGDVVFWHPRILHSAGKNYSMIDGNPCIRIVIPCDFQKNGRTFFDDDEYYGPGKREQWWVDVRNFTEDYEVPTPENLWSGWNI